MSSVWGRHFIIDIFGESHGPKIGAVLHGVPAGTVLDFPRLRTFLDRRRPGGEAWSTKRHETDDFELVSGYYYGHATGTPMCVLFHNADMHSNDYESRPNRPGHADYTGHVRYDGFNDPRGGGHFSGRLTAPLVFAGAVAAQILEKKGVYAATHVRRIADVDDAAFDKTNIPRELADSLAAMRLPMLDDTKAAEMEQRVKEAAADNDSVGGVVECAVCGLPAGLGSPIFGAAESVISSLLMAVPAVKGVSFGEGFGFSTLRGSEANDSYVLKNGQISAATNHNGGILGGITNGSPLVFEAVVKPTASISKPQQTVNLQTMEEETITVKGRHDACIVPRAAVAIEAAAYVAVLDLMMERGW
jgi:chorismate synthase